MKKSVDELLEELRRLPPVPLAPGLEDRTHRAARAVFAPPEPQTPRPGPFVLLARDRLLPALLLVTGALYVGSALERASDG